METPAGRWTLKDCPLRKGTCGQPKEKTEQTRLISQCVRTIHPVCLVSGICDEQRCTVVGELVGGLDLPAGFHIFSLLFQSLLRILETPKGHAAFRVSSGFNGLLSLLSDLEGSLQLPAVTTCSAVSPSQTLELVLHTLCVVSAALHLDPVNKHFFRSNGLFEKLAEDLCLLGCFGAPEEEGAQRYSSSDMKARPFVDLLSGAFSSSCQFPPRVQSCLQILSFLESMAGGTLHLHRDLMEPSKAGQVPSLDARKGEPGSRQGKFKQWPDPEERLELGWLLLFWGHQWICGPFLCYTDIPVGIMGRGATDWVCQSCQTLSHLEDSKLLYPGA